ncbi:MAG: Sapep family Mn(2+)-dependent dipeptidase [Coriobacteriales bacterium]|nr:Sapep family Mn(2+)-dependent dipeptidase [Coriobacteriales bacterium]
MNNDDRLIAAAQEYVDQVWEDVVRDIDYLVQVESVEDKELAQDGMPFGPGPAEALNRSLQIAERLGLDAHSCEGYVGYADLAGESAAYISTIAHSDIVPLGKGWTVDPLRVTRKDGFLLGRGVIDDKGPLVLSLYAAHFFARKVAAEGIKLPYTLRCIVGTNEETGMADVDYYLSHFPEPAFCFTPDASFPLICGEKGRFFAAVASKEIRDDDARILRMDGGTVANAVPQEAEALVRACASELPASERIAVKDAGVDDKGQPLAAIHATGRGGHAAMPEGTINAIALLVRYLVENDLCGAEERPFLDFGRRLLQDSFGKGMGIDVTDDVFDPLTCVGGTLRTEETPSGRRFVQTMDVRYPKSTDAARLLGVVERVACEHGCTITQSDDMVPFYMSPDSEEVRTLVGTYNQITGRNVQAFTIGGGTYARHFGRAVAFGPDDPAYPNPDWVGIEHGPDEGVSEEALKRALVIYVVSIARLMRLDLG